MFAPAAQTLKSVIGESDWQKLSSDAKLSDSGTFFRAFAALETRMKLDPKFRDVLETLDPVLTTNGMTELLRQVKSANPLYRPVDFDNFRALPQWGSIRQFIEVFKEHPPEQSEIRNALTPTIGGKVVSPKDGVMLSFRDGPVHIAIFTDPKIETVNRVIVDDGIDPIRTTYSFPSEHSQLFLAWTAKHKNSVQELARALVEFSDHILDADETENCTLRRAIPDSRYLRGQITEAELRWRFQDRQIPDLDTFRSRLAGLPFVNKISFLGDFVPVGGRERKLIPVSAIVGTLHDDSWDMQDRGGEAYVHDLAGAIIAGHIIPDSSVTPIVVVEKNGEYAVSTDGRHRTAALKGLDHGTLMIWAEVCCSAPLENREQPPRAEWKVLTLVKEFADKISRKFKDS